MPNKTLSIIIVNYRSEALLINCIASLYNKIILGEKIEIIVVNNDKQENLQKISSIYPHIKIINSTSNRGFGAGVNLGAKNARGEILLFLNPDTEILSENINEVIRLFAEDLKLGVLGGRLVDENDNTQKWSVGREINLFNLMVNNISYKLAEKIWESDEPKEVDWVSGTALFIRKDIFKKINGFDENFFMYFEDMDICKKVRKEKGKVLYYPNFSIKHMGGKCYSQENQQKKDYYRSQAYYFKKNRNFFEWQAVRMFQKIFF